MDLKPIPAFYCCYLLRSTVRHASFYIGSTPNAKRRLLQHNGLVTGGAFKTSRNTLRPWEMVCIVSGFPSNIAALQFEWTWQNPHLTRRILEEERITIRETVRKISRSGKVYKRPARPRMSLKDRLANLHLLLRVPSFARWPLKVTFFNQDVYDTWTKHVKHTNGLLGDHVEVIADIEPHVISETLSNRAFNSRISALKVDYEQYKSHLEKSMFLLADGEDVACTICKLGVDTPANTAVVCSHHGCRSASHLACLSKEFLAEEKSQRMVPSSGSCPSCKRQLQWSVLVTELSLRMRGEKEIAKLMKRRRTQKPKGKVSTAQEVANGLDEDEDDDEDGPETENDNHETICIDNVIDEPLRGQAEDEFIDLDDFDDVSSVTSVESHTSLSRTKQDTRPEFRPPPDLTVVIEDSEYDSSEAID